MRFQKESATLHGEISVLENAGRLKGNVYKNCTVCFKTLIQFMNVETQNL